MSTQISHSPSHDFGAWRDQFRLTHTFHLTSGQEIVAGQLEAALKSAQASIEKWVISRRGGCYEHCITVEGIGDESARELRKELSSLNGAIKVHVEHMVHLGSAAARQ